MWLETCRKIYQNERTKGIEANPWYIYEKRDYNEALLDIWYYFMHLFPESPRVSRMRKKCFACISMAVNCHKICYLDGEQFRKALARGNIAKMNKKSPNSTSKTPLVQGHLRNCVRESFKKRKKLWKIAEELVEETSEETRKQIESV